MRKHICDLTQQLISIDSVDTKKENLQKVIDIAVNNLEGFTIERFNQNGRPSILVYKENNRPNKFKIILNAHLDVVSGNQNQFKPFTKNGGLFGRGASDMKGAAAVEILVFKNLAKTFSYPLGLQLVTDEEIGGYDGVLHQIKQKVRTEFALAGEPTNYGICNQAKGVIWLKICTKGLSAHGAYQWKGENAILKMKKAIDVIESEYPLLTKEEWRTTINIAMIKNSNTTYNKVPDDCELHLDIRYIPEDWKTIKKKIEKMFKGMTLEFIKFDPPQITNKNNVFVKSLQTALENETNKKAQIVFKHGASDIRHFNGAGDDGVIFGPIGEGMHSDNEWVDIQSLETYYNILSRFLKSIK